jgi:histone arginine demethylase JMJD6
MNTPPWSTVERRAGLTREQFVGEYQQPGRPVVFTDLTKGWPALGKFSPDYFRKHCGDRTVPIGTHTYKLAEFLDLLEQSTPERPAPYPCKLDMNGDYADLASEVPRPALALPDRTRSRLIPSRFRAGSADLEVFIGGPGGEFPYIHYDYLGYYAFINQVYGEKEFFVYPPGQEEFLYPDPERRWLSTVNNSFKPDLEKYPLFAKAKPAVLTLGPGETLFIPAGAWHTARSKTISISVAFDQLSPTNWDFYVNELVRLYYPTGWKKAAVRGYLSAVNGVLSVLQS